MTSSVDFLLTRHFFKMSQNAHMYTTFYVGFFQCFVFFQFFRYLGFSKKPVFFCLQEMRSIACYGLFYSTF